MSNVTKVATPSKFQVLPESLLALYLDEVANFCINTAILYTKNLIQGTNKENLAFVSFVDAVIVSSRISLPIMSKMLLQESFVADDCQNQSFCIPTNSTSHISLSVASRAIGGYISTEFFYNVVPQFAPVSMESKNQFSKKIYYNHAVKNAVMGAIHGANSHIDYNEIVGFGVSVVIEIVDNYMACYYATGDYSLSLIVAGTITATSILCSGGIISSATKYSEELGDVINQSYKKILSTMKGEVAELPMPKMAECALGLVDEKSCLGDYSDLPDNIAGL